MSPVAQANTLVVPSHVRQFVGRDPRHQVDRARAGGAVSEQGVTLVVDPRSRHLYERAAALFGFAIEEHERETNVRRAIQTGATLETVLAVARPPVARPPVIAAEPWIPLCMTREDYGDWLLLNDKAGAEGDRTGRPCVDCPRSYAAEMRAIERCNGEPGLAR